MARNDNFIARDELLYRFAEIMPEMGENEVADEMYQIALEAGSIDVDYVRHGRWVEEHTLLFDGVSCSGCKRRLMMARQTPPYCPWCGAKMGLEVGDK